MLFVNSAKCFSQVSLKYKRIDYRKQLAYIITNIVVFKQTRLVQNLKETLCISSIPNELLPMRNSMLCSIRPAVSMKPQKGGNRKWKERTKENHFYRRRDSFIHFQRYFCVRCEVSYGWKWRKNSFCLVLYSVWLRIFSFTSGSDGKKKTLKRKKKFLNRKWKKKLFHLVLKGFWYKKSSWILTSSKF